MPLELPHNITPHGVGQIPQHEKDKNLRNHSLTLALGSADRGISAADAITRAKKFMAFIDGDPK